MSNRIKKAAGGLYAFLWWHTQVWLDPVDRRPYTYMMRDFYHQYPLIVVTLLATFFYSMGAFWYWVPLKVFAFIVISLFIGEVLGHLFWGESWKPGEQEKPTYNPKKRGN